MVGVLFLGSGRFACARLVQGAGAAMRMKAARFSKKSGGARSCKQEVNRYTAY